MTRRQTTRSRSAREAEQADEERTTRRQLLVAAGNVFAERGYDRATGKEICQRAGINTAAVNYYFGGIEGLYAAVLEEAHDRLVTLGAVSAAIAGKADAEAKLRAILELFVQALTAPTSESWVLRVIGREIVAPSPVLETLRKKELLPKARLLRTIVAELTGLPEDHPAVSRGCISVVAPCLMMLLVDRGTLGRMFPNVRLSSDDSNALVEHLTHFALAGLSAVATEARENVAAR